MSGGIILIISLAYPLLVVYVQRLSQRYNSVLLALFLNIPSFVLIPFWIRNQSELLAIHRANMKAATRDYLCDDKTFLSLKPLRFGIKEIIENSSGSMFAHEVAIGLVGPDHVMHLFEPGEYSFDAFKLNQAESLSLVNTCKDRDGLTLSNSYTKISSPGWLAIRTNLEKQK